MENSTICGTVPEKPLGAALDRRGLTCLAGNLKGPTERPRAQKDQTEDSTQIWGRGVGGCSQVYFLHGDLEVLEELFSIKELYLKTENK